MKRGGTGGVLLVLVMVSCSWAYTFLDVGVGSGVFQGSARCAGMGEVGLICEETAFAAALNPASLAKLDRPQVTGAYRFFSLEETWSFPTYDSFDALLGYTTYSANSNLYHSGAIGACSGVLPQAFGIALACALVPAYDYSYDFHEELRDRSTTSVPPDAFVADSYIEGAGDITSFTVGGARALGERLSVGLSLDYLWGEYELTGRLTNVDTSRLGLESAKAETSDTFKASDLSGVRYRLGMRYEINPRVEVAASVTTGCELDGAYTTTAEEGLLSFLPRRSGEGGDLTVEYPTSYALGVTFRPRNELLTVIEADVRLTEWSQAGNDAILGLDPKDTYQWHIGVEHVFYNGRPVRFGFVYKPSPVDDETNESGVTIGSAIGVSGFDIEFAGKIGWREYRYFDLFDDSIFGAPTREFSDLVEETSVSGMISIHRRF